MPEPCDSPSGSSEQRLSSSDAMGPTGRIRAFVGKIIQDETSGNFLIEAAFVGGLTQVGNFAGRHSRKLLESRILDGKTDSALKQIRSYLRAAGNESTLASCLEVFDKTVIEIASQKLFDSKANTRLSQLRDLRSRRIVPYDELLDILGKLDEDSCEFLIDQVLSRCDSSTARVLCIELGKIVDDSLEQPYRELLLDLTKSNLLNCPAELFGLLAKKYESEPDCAKAYFEEVRMLCSRISTAQDTPSDVDRLEFLPAVSAFYQPQGVTLGEMRELFQKAPAKLEMLSVALAAYDIPAQRISLNSNIHERLKDQAQKLITLKSQSTTSPASDFDALVGQLMAHQQTMPEVLCLQFAIKMAPKLAEQIKQFRVHMGSKEALQGALTEFAQTYRQTMRRFFVEHASKSEMSQNKEFESQVMAGIFKVIRPLQRVLDRAQSRQESKSLDAVSRVSPSALLSRASCGLCTRLSLDTVVPEIRFLLDGQFVGMVQLYEFHTKKKEPALGLAFKFRSQFLRSISDPHDFAKELIAFGSKMAESAGRQAFLIDQAGVGKLLSNDRRIASGLMEYGGDPTKVSLHVGDSLGTHNAGLRFAIKWLYRKPIRAALHGLTLFSPPIPYQALQLGFQFVGQFRALRAHRIKQVIE